MHETSKCEKKRQQLGEFDKYLKGAGLDIGCGPDPLKVPNGTVRGWDMKDGDAQYLKGINNGTFDFVYSSHCLEHMVDVPTALKHWSRVLKKGGYLYTVIPDYLYYEKCLWPSKYNPDHKHSFSQVITRAQTQRQNHWHLLEDLWPAFGAVGIEWIEDRLEIDNYDWNKGPQDQTLGPALSQLCIIGCKL